MLAVSLTDPLGDLEIARVERGHEVGVDEQRIVDLPATRATISTPPPRAC
jgi:hypothetical protein